jgi:tetratricopeptide (TPR) repeat protein
VAALSAAAGLRAEGPIDLPSRNDRWIQVRTTNFTLYGDASESKTREVGLEMEKLHAVLRALKSDGNVAFPIPTFIYVFKNEQVMEPYLPPGDHRIISYFHAEQEANYVQLTAAWNSDPRKSTYHNYIYYFLDANFPRQPLWYEQGVAAYYSTFRTEGNEVKTGMIREDYLARLRETMMMIPLDRLFAADRKSPEYTDEIKRSTFDAESWALVHYLMVGNPERTPQLGRFLALLQQGQPQDDAFRAAFQTDYATLFGELVGYVRNKRFPYNRREFAELKFPTEASTTPMAYATVLCRLGDLLLNTQGRLADAERYFQAAIDTEANADALAGLGMVRLRQEKRDEALEFFEKAVATDRADYRAQYYFARLKLDALSKTWTWPITDAERSTIEASRAALRKSIALNPEFPEARVELGRSYSVEQPDHLDEGLVQLTIAVKLLPTRADVARDLATMSERKNQRATATTSGSPATPGRSGGSDASDGSQDALADVNALLAKGKQDEAVALLEHKVASASGGMREAYQEELDKLRAGVARNRALREYNKALGLYNKHEYRAALEAFDKIVAAKADPDITRAAAEKAKQLRPLVKK